MTLFVAAAGAFLGSLVGNVLLFWGIGILSQREQKKRLKELESLQAQYMQHMQKESERMKKYAEMEG